MSLHMETVNLEVSEFLASLAVKMAEVGTDNATLSVMARGEDSAVILGFKIELLSVQEVKREDFN